MTVDQTKDSGLAATTLDDFMSGPQRLFKIGVYYPRGHAILDKATERFMVQLANIAGENPSVSLHIHEASLFIEGVKVSTAHPFVDDFSSLLSTLGIRELIIDREISIDELHVFVRRMLSSRFQVRHTKQFSQMELDELPPSITLRYKKFLALGDQSISESSSEAAENIDVFVDSLYGMGLSEEEVGKCRVVLDALAQKFNGQQLSQEGLPNASWDDVARMLARMAKEKTSLQVVEEGQRTVHESLDALTTILAKLERDEHGTVAREAIDLLISILRQPPGEEGGKVRVDEVLERRMFPEKPDIQVSRIQKFCDEKQLSAQIIERIPHSSNNGEVLSILMLLARSSQPVPVQIRMQQLFREFLSKNLGDKGWEILVSGFYDIVCHEKRVQLASIIRLLTEPLRRDHQGDSLKLFKGVLQLCSPAESQRLWPFVVNELLVVGSGGGRDVYNYLCQFCAGFSFDTMNELLSQLQEMESFQDLKISTDIFTGIDVMTFPLFAFLMKTEIESYVGERVLGGLRRRSPDWLIQAVVPLLDLKDQEHKMFLYSYLRQAPSKVISGPIKNVAAKIICKALPQLSVDRRSELWVEATIRALARLPSPETSGLLEKIAKEKKMLLLPEWPATCRNAAELALAEL